MTVLGIIGAILMHFLLGYQIVTLSRVVRKEWGRGDGENFGHSSMVRLVLYPISSNDLIGNLGGVPGAVNQGFLESRKYVFWHLFPGSWELRLTANLLICLLILFSI